MKTQNKIPELNKDLMFEYKTVYYLQKIFKYDEGYSESSIIGVWYSQDGDIDEAMLNAIRQEKEFYKYNKSIKPHTFTIRKIKATISSEEIESKSEHYGSQTNHRVLKCSYCGGCINYGDEVLIKKYESDDKYFCCSDCLAKYEDATICFPDDNEYDKLFCVESD